MTDTYDDDETPVPPSLSPKERRLHQLRTQFENWRSRFPSTGLEEDEAVERVNEAIDELIELQSRD
jgi:hypothetical protein